MYEAKTELAKFLGPIIPLTARFVAGEISGEDYEVAFFRLYQELPVTANEALFEAGERYFGSVEDHVADEQLREPGDVTTDQLREKARDLLRLAGM